MKAAAGTLLTWQRGALITVLLSSVFLIFLLYKADLKPNSESVYNYKEESDYPVENRGFERGLKEEVRRELREVKELLRDLGRSQDAFLSKLDGSEFLGQSNAALKAWQDKTVELSFLANPLYARPRKAGLSGSEPNPVSVTITLCGLTKGAIESAVSGAPNFSQGCRWLVQDKWLTYDQLLEADKAGALGDASSPPVCILGYMKKQVPCVDGECLVPVYVRPQTSDVLVVWQMYEQTELEFLQPHAPRTILDGGANIGLASQIFGYMYPGATVVAIEAASRNFEMLRLNTAHLPNVVPLHAGIWSRTTPLHVTNTPDGEWGHILLEVDTCPLGAECVNAVTIDFLLDLLSIDGFEFVKLDIESSEKAVFTKSASNQLRWLEGVSLVAIELHDRFIPNCTETVRGALDGDFNVVTSNRTEYVVAVRRLEKAIQFGHDHTSGFQ